MVEGLLLALLFGLLWTQWKLQSLGRELSNFSHQQEMAHKHLLEIEQHNLERITSDLARTHTNLNQHFHNAAVMQNQRLDAFATQMANLTKLNEMKLHNMQDVLAKQLELIRGDNSQKLESIRATVEEKLHDTLEKRLNNSFNMISERLEVVHRSMGEMQNLASGVGDLKRVLSNVRTRGIWGEVQLEAIINQLLTPDQFAKNVQVDPSEGSRVEFAVKMPGQHDGQHVWLPIDAKFPIEGYQRLMEAHETGDLLRIREEEQLLESVIKKCAKTISQLYIKPPHTTDFALMFLPIEGLYAEVLRYPGLFEHIQQELRVVITAPTTLSAILNSLQMGFRTLAIHQRSSEVWQLLGTIKSEFSRFGDVLSKTKHKLEQATKVIGDAEVRTRVINRKLRMVETISTGEAEKIADLAPPEVIPKN